MKRKKLTVQEPLCEFETHWLLKTTYSPIVVSWCTTTIKKYWALKGIWITYNKFTKWKVRHVEYCSLYHFTFIGYNLPSKYSTGALLKYREKWSTSIVADIMRICKIRTRCEESTFACMSVWNEQVRTPRPFLPLVAIDFESCVSSGPFWWHQRVHQYVLCVHELHPE